MSALSLTRRALSDPDPRSPIAAACGSPALSRRRLAKIRRIVRQDFEPSRTPQHQTTSIGRLYVRIRAYLAKVHRTSGARTGFSRPIIKMHARYVTTLCTYVPKYYPAPVPALSFSLSLSFSRREILQAYTGCPESTASSFQRVKKKKENRNFEGLERIYVSRLKNIKIS